MSLMGWKQLSTTGWKVDLSTSLTKNNSVPLRKLNIMANNASMLSNV